MANVIQHFMWGYQPHFRIGREVAAKSLFRMLDERFEPEVFLVGVLVDDLPGRYKACVEPERDFWIQSETFDDVLARSRELVATYPESEVIHTDPLADEWEAERLRRRAVRDIISEVICEQESKPDDMRYFPSSPVAREGYLVSLVLGLQESIINSHARLVVDQDQIHPYHRFEIPVSLIDAAVVQFLDDSRAELLTPDAGAGSGAGRGAGELIRMAGAQLVTARAHKADSDLDNIGYWQGLFDTCNAISSLRYERAAGRGRIVLARPDHRAIRPIVAFENPVGICKHRRARKLLELASGGLELHINPRVIFGLVKVDGYDAIQEDLYEIDFLDQHHWVFRHAGRELMHVVAGQPRLPAPSFSEARLRMELGRVFRGSPGANADAIVGLVGQAAAERHGTMLVVIDDPASEAGRLAGQATCVHPLPLTPELLRHLTPIDGAVLIGPDAVCHAIGVVLDGMATDKGDAGRGARGALQLRRSVY